MDEDYYRAPRGRLTTKCYGHNIGDRSDESQNAPSRVEMGNPGLIGNEKANEDIFYKIVVCLI